MFILQANQIKKSYGVRTILEIDGFQIYEGDKIGVVGSNGAGKTTLLRILAGDLEPDEGSVTRYCKVALIRQLPEKEGTLSGGENAKRRILEETLLDDTILFADEPTANLDAEGVGWIRSKLKRAATVVLISHDRLLLNEICTRIVEVKDGALRHYTGSYSDYEKVVEEEKARRRGEHDAYRKEKEQLEAAVRLKEQKVARQRQKKRREYATNLSEARLGGHKRKASMQKQEKQAKVLKHRLERLEPVEIEKEPPKLRIDFSLTNPPGNKNVVTCDRLSFAYGERIIFKNASFLIKNRSRVTITGKNGAGKSTLLRLIYEGCDAIQTAPKLRPGFLFQGFENLDPERSVLDNVLSTSIQDSASARSVLAGLLFCRDDVYKPVGVLSGGEKLRISIAKLVTGDFNALLLDEPTNYLDIRSMEAVERVLREYPGTIIMVSHDRHFIDRVATEELSISDYRVTEVVPQKSVSSSFEQTKLEMRKVRILEELSGAGEERRNALEAEYNQLVRELNRLKRS